MGNLTLNGATSGQITLSPTAVAGTNTLTLPASTGTVLTTAGGQTISGTTTVSTINATTIQVGGNQAVDGPAFSAYAGSTTSISAGTTTKVALNTKEFDTNSNYDNTTNYRFTPTVAGYYQITACVRFAALNTSEVVVILYKNSSAFKSGTDISVTSSGVFVVNVSALIYFNGSTDYVEAFCYSGSAATVAATQTGTYFQGVMVRGA
jgi:hypothetical protein